MVRIGFYSVLFTALVIPSLSVAAQTPAAPAATADLPCAAPGQGRGPRPGGPGGPGGAAGGAGGAGQRPGAGGAAAAAQGPGGGGPGGPGAAGTPPKKRLLIWADNRNGIAQHDIGHAEAVIEELGYKSGLYDTYIRTDSNIISKHPKMTTGEAASGGPSLCNVDAIFFLGHREVELDAAGRADLLWFVHDAGKGFVAAHTGLTAFSESWPEFVAMLGGTFDQHPWGTPEAKVIVVDPKFPGMQGFGSSFTLRDEFYQAKEFSPEKSRVLLRLDTSTVDMTSRGVQAADYPYPLAWARMYGKGRVFYSSFAHAPATWDNPQIQEMYLGAIKWALGLVEADATPIPMPPPPAPAAGK
jgi:type 1 glutamine amidotransferase